MQKGFANSDGTFFVPFFGNAIYNITEESDFLSLF